MRPLQSCALFRKSSYGGEKIINSLKTSRDLCKALLKELNQFCSYRSLKLHMKKPLEDDKMKSLLFICMKFEWLRVEYRLSRTYLSGKYFFAVF